MVIVFLPALEGLRPQWREAAVNLGATHLAVLAPGRRPAAHARLPRRGAAAVRQRVRGLRDRGGPGQPGQPDRAAADPGRADQRGRCSGQANVGYALALEMIVVVAVVMAAYDLLLRRTVEVAAMSRRRLRPGRSARLLPASLFGGLLPRSRCWRCSTSRTQDPGQRTRDAPGDAWAILVQRRRRCCAGDHHLAAARRCSPSC